MGPLSSRGFFILSDHSDGSFTGKGIVNIKNGKRTVIISCHPFSKQKIVSPVNLPLIRHVKKDDHYDCFGSIRNNSRKLKQIVNGETPKGTLAEYVKFTD